MVLLKIVIRTTSILVLNHLTGFSIIRVFIDRNFRIDNDSWSMYVKPSGIQYMDKNAIFCKQISKNLKNSNSLLLLSVCQLKVHHDIKIKIHKLQLYLNYFSVLN